MAVVLRLARHGQNKRPFYRVIAAERERSRDGRYIELLGTYNPMKEPAAIDIKQDRIQHWLDHGAKPTSVLRDIIKKQMPGVIEAKEDHQRKKIQEARKKRKARQAKK